MMYIYIVLHIPGRLCVLPIILSGIRFPFSLFCFDEFPLCFAVYAFSCFFMISLELCRSDVFL